ncbi:MAG TPA: TasA family protein [Nocardioides sp.]|nr:TasA family protein [Nocardioides sp.]
MKMSKKVLVPLATMAAAGAIAVGSGATFTSQSNNTISAVTSGTLTQSNSKDGGAVFDLTNMKPGDTLNGSLVLTNTGSLPATFSLTETASSNAFTGDNLTLAITNVTTGASVYSGTFGGLVDGTKTDLGVVQPKAANTYRFTVKLAASTPNADQGKTASAAYQWDSIQLNGETYNQ